MCVPGTCKCKGCENDDTTAERKEKRDKAVTEMAKKKSNAFQSRFGGEGEEKAHLTGCNCKRSGCQRRYCECYQSGAKCTEKCKCCECKNPHGTNPHYRPIPPETVKGLPTSPGGTPLVIDGVEGGTAPVQVVNSPGGGGEPSPKHLVVPLQAPNKQQVPAASVPSTIQPPSPTAFVSEGLLAACNAAATEDASRKSSRPGVWNAPAGTDKGRSSSSSTQQPTRVASAIGNDVADSEVARLRPPTSLRVSTSLPGPSPDPFAADTPEPFADTRATPELSSAAIRPSPLAAPGKDALSALPVLMPVLPAPGRVLPQMPASGAPPAQGIVLNAVAQQAAAADVKMVDAV